jgi:hypothetical protein
MNLPRQHLFNVGEYFSREKWECAEGVVMRGHRIFVSCAIAMGCGSAIQSTAFSQEYRGTWEQQMACTADGGRGGGGVEARAPHCQGERQAATQEALTIAGNSIARPRHTIRTLAIGSVFAKADPSHPNDSPLRQQPV